MRGNQDVAVAERFWQATYLDQAGLLAQGVGQEGSPDEPPKFKAYLDRPRVGLPQQLPLRLGGLADVLSGETARLPERLPAGDRMDADTLGTLLYYGYGFSREDVGPTPGWPHHRLVPSARCFYPTELYVCVSDGCRVPAGVYHYDQLHHCLVTLRAGDPLGTVTAAAGADLDGADVVLVLTSHYWKTAFRYRHYAYRLCCQETGMVAGNLLLVAAALGLTGQVHHQFLDAAVDRLLGVVNGEERAMVVLPLYSAPGPPVRPRAGSPVTAAELCADVPPIRAPFRDVDKDLTVASRLYEMDRHSVLASTAEFAEPSTPSEPVPPVGGRVPLQAPAADPDLAAVLRERSSGGTLFRPVRGAVSAAALSPIARYATAPVGTDLGPAPFAQVYLVVQHVSGTPPGVYRVVGGELYRLGDLPAGGLPLDGPPVMDATAVNVFCYVVGDRARATTWLGNRGYRVANIDAGIVAQRICVLAAAAGLAARPTNGYLIPDVQRLLGIDDPGLLPLFQIALGRRSPGPQYELPIVF